MVNIRDFRFHRIGRNIFILVEIFSEDFNWSRRGVEAIFRIPQNVRLLKSFSLSLFGRVCGIACIGRPTHRLNRRNLEFELVGVTVTAAMSTTNGVDRYSFRFTGIEF